MDDFLDPDLYEQMFPNLNGELPELELPELPELPEFHELPELELPELPDFSPPNTPPKTPPNKRRRVEEDAPLTDPNAELFALLEKANKMTKNKPKKELQSSIIDHVESYPRESMRYLRSNGEAREILSKYTNNKNSSVNAFCVFIRGVLEKGDDDSHSDKLLPRKPESPPVQTKIISGSPNHYWYLKGARIEVDDSITLICETLRKSNKATPTKPNWAENQVKLVRKKRKNKAYGIYQPFGPNNPNTKTVVDAINKSPPEFYLGANAWCRHICSNPDHQELRELDEIEVEL